MKTRKMGLYLVGNVLLPFSAVFAQIAPSFEVSYHYNRLGQVKQLTHSTGATATPIYNVVGQTTGQTRHVVDESDPSYVVFQDFTMGIQHNLLNQVTRSTFAVDANGEQQATLHGATRHFNSLGQLTQQTTDWSDQLIYHYLADGQLQQVDATQGQLQRNTVYSYDTNGRLKQMELKPVKSSPDVIDIAPHLITTYNYTPKGQLQRLSYGDGSSALTYQYYAAGPLKTLSHSDYSLNYTYDGLGRLHSFSYGESAVQPIGLVVNHYAPDTGRLSSVTTPLGTQTYHYNDLGEVATVVHQTSQGGELYTQHYYYDHYNRLERFENTRAGVVLSGTQNYYSTKRAHDIIQIDRYGSLVTSNTDYYHYDARDRLIYSKRCNFRAKNNCTTTSYSYQQDNNSDQNLLQHYSQTAPNGKVSASYRYNNAGGLDTLSVVHTSGHDSYASNYSFAYDEAGNLKNNNKGADLSYNSRNQLVKAVVQNSTTAQPITYTYSYAPNGLRQSKCSISLSEQHCEQYYHDASGRLVASHSGATWNYYPVTGERVTVVNNRTAQHRVLITDLQGSTVAELDVTTGNLMHTYQYADYGQQLTTQDANDTNPFRYAGSQGYYSDPELHASHLPARELLQTTFNGAPVTQWFQRDSMGYLFTALGKSLVYSYLPRGNSISGVDLSGHGLGELLVTHKGVVLNILSYLLPREILGYHQMLGLGYRQEGFRFVSRNAYNLVEEHPVPYRKLYGRDYAFSQRSLKYFRRALAIRLGTSNGDHLSFTDDVLASFGNLQRIWLYDLPNITDEGLAHLANVKRVRLSHLPNVTDEGLAHLAHVKRVRLHHLPNITDEGLVHFSNVKRIWLGELGKVTNEGLVHLVKVADITLFYMPKITDEGLVHLANAEKVALEEMGDFITLAGVMHLLNVSTVTIVDEGGEGEEMCYGFEVAKARLLLRTRSRLDN